jgi:ribosomal protein S20
MRGQRRHLHGQLQQPPQHHTAGQARWAAGPSLQQRRTPPGGGDHAQVQQHRRHRRHGKALPGVQDAGRQRHQRHEADVGEHPARHQHRGRSPSAPSHQPDQHRRGHHARAQVTSSTQASTVATASTRPRVAASPSRARVAASNGTKACENAPSANSRRNRLGMRKATLKASVAAPAPNSGGDHLLAHQPGDPRQQGQQRETVEARLEQIHGKGQVALPKPAHYRPEPPAGTWLIGSRPAAPLAWQMLSTAPCYTRQSLHLLHPHSHSMATSSKAKKKTVRLASGRKRARQDVVLNAANTSLRSRFRTVVKNVQKAVVGGDKAKAAETVQVRPERDRLGGRQGHLPQEQGRPPEEPPGGQGQGPGAGRLIRFAGAADARARKAGPLLQVHARVNRGGGSRHFRQPAATTCRSLSRAKFMTKSQAIGSMSAALR